MVKGEKLDPLELGIMHGYMSVKELKKVSAGYGVSINEYLVAAFLWSIYQDSLHGAKNRHGRPISSCVPVNLRPYFDSITMKNFFVIVSAVFKPEKENYTFEEVIKIVAVCISYKCTCQHYNGNKYRKHSSAGRVSGIYSTIFRIFIHVQRAKCKRNNLFL